MRKIYSLFLTGLVATSAIAQEDSTKTKDLENVVITGQYRPQSIKNSVYQVRVVGNERIRLSGATTVQQVLNNQLGFRFTNDNTLGATDVNLMGVDGRNIKILLDGVPINDRNDARESVNQIDINTIERIEIVEGPMSVSYGSDALAGVINIITKKHNSNTLSVTARVQEETAGDEYHAFNYKGVHNQHIGINYNKNSWNFGIGGTHNEFNGFGGDAYGRGKAWLPKEQFLGNVKLGYAKTGFDIYYRLDALDETITDKKTINLLTYRAINKEYAANRYIHQFQSGWSINSKWQLNNVLSFTNYKRKTTTGIKDFAKNTEQLSTADGDQDLAKLNNFLFRSTVQYKASERFSLQPGVEIETESAKAQRIAGEPDIAEYALFASAEIKPTSKINIRPGVRFVHNSIYDAPPALPSLNTKFNLSKTLDLRLAYARGFRSPELRELYFLFVDANHNIQGNSDLKAEQSNSFTGSLSFAPAHKGDTRFSTVLGTFYNSYINKIELTQDANDLSRYSYFNVGKVKTTGVTLDNTVSAKNITATLGFAYIGYATEAYDKGYIKENDKDFIWSPEINSNITYVVPKIKTSLSFFYKFNGKQPFFATTTNNTGQNVVYIAQAKSYNLADFTITTAIHKLVSVNAGIKNLFDVTNIANTATSGSVHSPSGAQAINYGRSYFLGLTFNWNKK